MAFSTERITIILRSNFPFNILDDDFIQQIIPRIGVIHLPAGTVIYRQGDIPDHFYYNISGIIQNDVIQSNVYKKSWKVAKGDCFGSEILRSNLYRLNDAVCKTDVELLRFDQSLINEICQEYPELRKAFDLLHQTFLLQIKLHLPWLGEEEKISLISRRHPFFLVLRIVLFGIAGFLAFGIILSLAFTPEGFSIGVFILALFVLLLGFGFTGWAALEWTNDYFFITHERVLVQKKLIGFFDSRQESPLSAILSTGLDTTFIGRAIGYGAITLRSYTGNLRFKNLPNPDLIYELLETQRYKVDRETRHQDQSEMQEALQQRFGDRTEFSRRRPVPKTNPSQNSIYQSGSLLDLAARFFGLRHAKDDGVVYRTHWWILLKKTILPGLVLIGAAVSVAFKFIGFLPNTSESVVYIIALVLTICAWSWWLYQYVDWHNDIYIITPDQLVDINRKPLGSEQRRSAPLKNIQTVEYKRKGIIGLVLNFGTVHIQIGNEELTFDNVYDPASIQAEIFAYFKNQSEKNKRQEQEKLADWIQAYDQIKRHEKGRTNPGIRDKSE